MVPSRLGGVVLGVGLALAGCGRSADSGATAKSNAPGSPGTGNAPVSAAPQQADGPTGGSPGPVGVVTPGSSGTGMPPGATARGTANPDVTRQMAGPPAPGASAAPSASPQPLPTQGSTNRSPGATY